MRRIIVDETAVARNPKAPDYLGLDLLFSGQVTEAGQAQVAKFNEWFGSRLKDGSIVLRQNRMWNEELRHANSETGNGKDVDGVGKMSKKKKKSKGRKSKADDDEEEEAS